MKGVPHAPPPPTYTRQWFVALIWTKQKDTERNMLSAVIDPT